MFRAFSVVYPKNILRFGEHILILKLFLPQLINLATKLKEYAYFSTFLRLDTTFFQRQV